MTPRQILRLLPVIDESKTVDMYISSLSYRLARNPKPPSLDEILALGSKEETKSEFKSDVDKKLDELAARRVQERRAQWRTTNS